MNTIRVFIPDPIYLVDQRTGERNPNPLGIFDWGCLQWFNDQRWHTNGNDARLIVLVGKLQATREITRLTEKHSLIQPEPLYVDLEDADWRILCEVVKAPVPMNSHPLQAPLISIQMEAFRRAILDAKPAPREEVKS